MKEEQDMSTTYLVSKETLKTICQGALGAMTFGAYGQYTNNKMMELNNRYYNDKIEEIKKENSEIKKENSEIKEQLNKRWWF